MRVFRKYTITNRIGAIKSQIYAENKEKITTSIQHFEKYVQADELIDRMFAFEPVGITPGMFQYNLLEKAKTNKKHIVLPEGLDERILQATKQLIDSDAVSITLLGDKKQIQKKIVNLGIPLDLDKINIVNPLESVHFDSYTHKLYELRKHKDVTLEKARELMEDLTYFGTMMVYMGEADGMVSGALHTTQDTIRPALQFIKTKPGTSLISSIFFMCLEDRVTVYGDCAINPNPTAEQLAEIAISSAETSIAFDIEPRIAMLSYSSGSSGGGEDVERVRKASRQKAPFNMMQRSI